MASVFLLRAQENDTNREKGTELFIQSVRDGFGKINLALFHDLLKISYISNKPSISTPENIIPTGCCR